MTTRLSQPLKRPSVWPGSSSCATAKPPRRPRPPSADAERLASFEAWLDRAGLLDPPDPPTPSRSLNASLYQALRPAVVDRFVATLRAMTYANPLTATPPKPVSASTIRKNVAAVKTFAAWCAEEGHLDLNQLAGYRLPPVPEPERQPFSDAQVVAMVEATKSWTRSRWRNLAILLLPHTGRRAGELLGIKPADLDLDQGWVRVWGNGARQRRVPIGPRVIEALESYQRLERRGSCPEFFESKKGGPRFSGPFALFAHSGRSGHALRTSRRGHQQVGHKDFARKASRSASHSSLSMVLRGA